MGTDMCSIVERKDSSGLWHKIECREMFDCRNYSVYAFLADIRNYDYCTPISKGNRGIPLNSEYFNEMVDDGFFVDSKSKRRDYLNDNCYGYSFLTLKELLDFDYNKTFWNRRIAKQISPNAWTGAGLAEEGEGVIISYRENLGNNFFTDLEFMKSLGEPENVRIIFWFC